MSLPTHTPLVGLYAWGGPGTIRLLQTKYHAPTIDLDSFLSLYDEETLSRAQQLFGVTDMWVTYSWGFSEKTEEVDRAFLRKRLDTFRKKGIRTHAYVQGLNVVTKDFATADLFCVDHTGQVLRYSKGRSFICPNNPNAIALILSRVEAAAKEAVNGVYIDNILFGLPPLYFRKDFASFFGCSCRYCQDTFETIFGYPLPLGEKRGQAVADYLAMRTSTITALLTRAQAICQAHNKYFGINLYDPYQHTDAVYYGYDLHAIDPLLDYYMIENHALPRRGANNSHLLPLLTRPQKPVFVVSYNKGIGFEPAYTQQQINAIFSESALLGYAPCLKATEFTTDGVWHALRVTDYTKPHTIPLRLRRYAKVKNVEKSHPLKRKAATLLQRRYAHILEFFLEKPRAYQALTATGFYQRQIQSWKKFDL